MNEFLAMGGYGSFVWPAYLVSAITLISLAGFIVSRAARARRRLSELQARETAKCDG